MANDQDTQSGADRATVLKDVRARFLEGLANIARAAGVYSGAALDALRTGTGGFFDEMASGSGRSGFETAQDLTASKIKLVDDSQLELSIRLADVARRIDEACATALYKLYQRFVTLLERPDLSASDNPVAPEGIGRGLAAMFEALGEGHDRAQERLGEIAGRLSEDMPLLYAELNERMMHHGVRAARTAGQPERGESKGGKGGAADPLAALQHAAMARLPAGAPAAPGQAAAMAGGVGGGVPGGMAGAAGISPVAAAYSAAMFEQVIGRLNQWQQQGQSDLFGEAPAAPVNALRALQTGELSPMMRPPDAATLDVLATLFDAVFDDPQLADAVKAAIARLQIPLLKAAILDPTFFNDRGHPARVLLDGMAQAAAGLGPNVDSEHPVCVELRRVAASVQAEFDRDASVFSDRTAELESFIARRNHDVQSVAQSFVPLAEVQEQRDIAALMAQRLVGTRTVETAPPVIAEFLRGQWRQVLETAWLSGGEESHAWRDARSVVPALLSSVQGKADAEERKHMAMQIPGLLQKIRAGLDSIGVSPEARAPFLDACLALQTAVLRGKAPTAEALAGDALVAEALGTAAAGESEAAEIGILEMNGLTLKLVRPKTPGMETAEDFADDISIGDWLEFQMPDGQRCRGRVCWLSPVMGNPLFASSEWDYAISVARSWLDRQLTLARASPAAAGSFFDRAAEKALRRER